MSTVIPAERVGTEARRMDWAKWARQTRAVCTLELRRNLLSKRSLLVYLLAGGPVLLMAVLAVHPEPAQELRVPATMLEVRAHIFSALILRTTIFFGCAWVFMNLFRGEIVDRSLHYYFLTAVRREVLVAGKYLSAAVTTILLFGLTTFATIALLYLPMGVGGATRHLTVDGGVGQLGAYLAISTLACVGYGALFLAIGLFFRNPILPAIVVYGWEAINFLLPPVLKKVSVIYYLNSLAPVPVSEGPFAIVAEPMPAWLAVPALLVFVGVVLVIAGYRIRKMEISYGSDT
jgi:ABC-type transport system involved in multi-copper enzyme maturation permease subunit